MKESLANQTGGNPRLLQQLGPTALGSLANVAGFGAQAQAVQSLLGMASAEEAFFQWGKVIGTLFLGAFVAGGVFLSSIMKSTLASYLKWIPPFVFFELVARTLGKIPIINKLSIGGYKVFQPTLTDSLLEAVFDLFFIPVAPVVAIAVIDFFLGGGLYFGLFKAIITIGTGQAVALASMFIKDERFQKYRYWALTGIQIMVGAFLMWVWN